MININVLAYQTAFHSRN